MECLSINFIYIKNIVFSLSFKNQLMKILNFICLLFLFYNAIDMTFDYLRFNYSYKLIVDDNKEGFDLPEINVCTENNILFAKTKVIQYFGVENDWNFYQIEAKKHYIAYEDKTLRSDLDIEETCIEELRDYQASFMSIYDSWKWRLNSCLNIFLKKYKNFIFNEMNFYELNSLTYETNDLFECSAKIENKFEVWNHTNLFNCFDRFESTKSIYVNKDFGICYKFFRNKEFKNILLKDNDHINITVKFSKQKDFMIVNRTIDYYNGVMNSLRYFVWYVMVSDRHSSIRETAIELNKVGFDARISFEMTSIELLSTPYMAYCVNNGKYYYI